ncbi:hypothetical protein DSO57_1023218 [Entomophthora muscae]|uniref:Uncharacterized protein n=1 Tax=Entomophthora muscae TaxID=34485 RepID=A0ACC2TEA5_9FUNG|nr:hypothetical protein DSO57_1023218 [Entomophthora muscae]
MIPLVWLFLLHGSICLVSACGGSIPGKRGRAVPWSTGPAAWEDPGSGFDPRSWAWGSRGGKLSILTSPQGQLPSCLQFFGLEPEQDLTTENPLKLGKSNSPTSIPPTPKAPDNLTNQRAGPATDPGITQAHAEEKTENLPIERGPPRDNQSHNLTRKVEHSQFKPANGITPALDATKDWEDLVNGKTRAKEICERFTMTDGHTYTLDCQEDVHHHSCNKVT